MSDQEITSKEVEREVIVEGMKYSDDLLKPLVPYLYKMIIEYFEKHPLSEK